VNDRVKSEGDQSPDHVRYYCCAQRQTVVAPGGRG
jgi:hypothetical protein